MKKLLFSFLLLLPFLFLLVTGFVHRGFKHPGTNRQASGSLMYGGYAVVELFTSEGCSSCPPADEALAKMDSIYKGKVFVLSYHVDYWDRGGWKDVFSSAGYTQRQSEYGSIFHQNSIYTPQAVVNGTDQFVGSDEKRLKEAIEGELSHTTNKRLALFARSKDGKKVKVGYFLRDSIDVILQVALVQLHAQSQVLKGENEGRLMRHINVVRDFQSIPLNGGRGMDGELRIPEGLTPKDCKVIIFVQEKESHHILAVEETLIK
ncbi:DUF1223 domain-containing protein [Flavitalea flava]